MRHTIALTVVGALVLTGALIFWYKAFELSFPLKPDTQSESWRIESRFSFAANNKPVKVDLMLPRLSEDFSIADESFVSNSYGLTSSTEAETGNRIAQWTKRRVNGRDVIFYRAVIYDANAKSYREEKAPVAVSPLYGSRAFATQAESNPYFLALQSVIEEIREQSADDTSFAQNLLKWTQQTPKDGRFDTIRNLGGSPISRLAAAKDILNYAGISARIMNGIILHDDARDIEPVARVEIYNNQRWRPVDGQMASDVRFLPWWTGDNPVFTLEGGYNAHVTISVKRHLEHALTEAIWQGDRMSEHFYAFSVYRLPVDVQILFSVLLMIPIGAVVVSFFRQMIGIKTFGTFMPILVAIAFRETQLAWGIVLFVTILLLGIVIRGLIGRLYLLMVPRLSCVLTGVVLVIYLLSILMAEFGINAGLSISLFPIVILTMLIERLSVVWEELGAREAFVNSLGSLLVAVVSYGAMTEPLVVHWITTFPELLLVVMGILIMIGRYNGFKLSEYIRFHSMKRRNEALKKA